MEADISAIEDNFDTCAPEFTSTFVAGGKKEAEGFVRVGRLCR